jgi:Helix-turn-helix domain
MAQVSLPFGPGRRWAVLMQLLERPNLKADDRLLLAVLFAHTNGQTGRTNPSLVRLARLMGRCVNSVKAARRRLIEAGILAVVTDARCRARYVLAELLPPAPQPAATPSPDDGHPSRPDGAPPTGVKPRLQPPAAPADRLRIAARREGPQLSLFLDQAQLTIENGHELHVACSAFVREALKREWDRLRRLADQLGLATNVQWLTARTAPG